MAAGAPLGAQADVAIDGILPESLGLELWNKLALKGFCVVAPFVGQDVLDTAIGQASGFGADGRWTKLNSIILEGLLGVEGSCEVAELAPPNGENEERIRQDGEVLVQLDYAMTQLGFAVEPYLGERGLDVSHRTAGLLHRCGEQDELPVPLTELDCAKWHSQFLRHRLMVCIFLGPSPGTLRLRPYETEQAEVHSVQILPGSTVVLRPDLMSHAFCSEGASLSLSTFFLQGRPQRCARGAQQMTPSARLLDDWTLSRLRHLKEDMSSDSLWTAELPHGWQTAMNHLFHKGQMISVVGAACRTPLAYDPGSFSGVQLFGLDCVTEVPMSRWDHERVFDPEPESYRRGKVYCRHASFMEGVELFDNKTFGLGAAESRAIDPHQRQILEVGYLSLQAAGYNKKTLINKYCGLYLGHGNAEWQMTERPTESSTYGATGTALSIAAGRFSFTLGLKGPSMTVDTEGSSGATAVYLGAENLQGKPGAESTLNDMSLAIGLRVLLCPVWWSSKCAGGWLSPTGRCLSFDSSADGYVYSDGVAAVTMAPFKEGGEKDHIGNIAGAMMMNSGRGATLSAPHGPAQQETMVECIRNAHISPFDIDAVETHGVGHDLGDAIEVGSILRVHRSEDVREPLSLMALKTATGNSVESGGILGLMKTMLSFWAGAMPPNLHLQQLNPHMDFGEPPCSFVSECCSYRMQSMFAGNLSQGFGGSNVYIVGWGQISSDRLPDSQPPASKQVTFWPGGGGELPQHQTPASGYYILGSWSQWEGAAQMDPEGDGVFGYTVTLGVNRWESFQILLDGDPAKLLHPGVPRASRDFPVEGPPEDAEPFRDCAWLLDGRGAAPPGEAPAGAPRADRDRPGDRYRVRLHVRGRWRSVSWEKQAPALEEGAGPPGAPEDTGRYFLVGALTGWSMEEMEADPATPGAFSAQVQLPFRAGGSEFLVVRNRDWSQVIYPSVPMATRASGFEVLGPDDGHESLLFCIEGEPGERFRISFQRTVGLDSDVKRVEWQRADA